MIKMLITSTFVNRHTRLLSPALQRVEYSQLQASRGTAHDVGCLATQPCHQLTPFYQSRLTQTQLIIPLQAASKCRTLTLQLCIEILEAAYFAIKITLLRHLSVLTFEKKENSIWIPTCAYKTCWPMYVTEISTFSVDWRKYIANTMSLATPSTINAFQG